MGVVFYIVGGLFVAGGMAILSSSGTVFQETVAGLFMVAGAVFIVGGATTRGLSKLTKAVLDSDHLSPESKK